MNILDYITIILFSIGVLITGVSFSKTGKDMKSFFLRWRQRTVGNEWTFIVHGIFLGRNFRRVGVDSLFVWNGINHYPAYNGCCCGYAVGTWIAPDGIVPTVSRLPNT